MTHSTLSSIVPPASSWPNIEEFTLVTQTITDWENGESWGGSNWGWGWKPDGTKMVIVTNATDVYYGFDLSTPFDMDTAVRNTAASSADVVGLSMSFSTDGLKYAQASWFSANDLDFYSTTVPFEPTNANRSLIGTISMGGFSSQDMYDTIVTRDGQHIFWQTQGNVPDKFQHYFMSTPWDPSTAVLQTDEFNSTLSGSGRMGISHNGLDMMTSNTNTKVITHYRMTVPYDLDTATLVSELNYSAGSLSNGVMVRMNDEATQLILGSSNTVPQQFEVRERPLAFAPTNAIVDYHRTDAIDETFDITLPANAAGDLICVFSFADGYTEARSPAFNTCTRQGAMNNSAGSDVGLDLWTRTSTGGEVTITGTSETSAVNRGVTIIFTLPAGTWNTGNIMDVTPAGSQVHNNYDPNTVVGNPNPITTVTNGALVVTTWQISNEEATATSPPTGYTFILDALLSDEPSTGSPQCAAAYKIVDSAGVEDPDTWDNTGDPTTDDSQSCVWAFRPA